MPQLVCIPGRLYIICFLQEQKQYYSLDHQNSNSLRQQFGISRECAHQVVKSGPQFPQFLPVPHNGVNPQGLLPIQL